MPVALDPPAELPNARAHSGEARAFVRLAPKLGDAENPGGYLRTVLVNLCRDEQRRRTLAQRHAPTPAAHGAPPDLPATTSAVWLALQDLPERQREALSLRFYADLPTDEIARLLDARPATVRSLIHRGLATLKEVVPRD